MALYRQCRPAGAAHPAAPTLFRADQQHLPTGSRQPVVPLHPAGRGARGARLCRDELHQPHGGAGRIPGPRDGCPAAARRLARRHLLQVDAGIVALLRRGAALRLEHRGAVRPVGLATPRHEGRRLGRLLGAGCRLVPAGRCRAGRNLGTGPGTARGALSAHRHRTRHLPPSCQDGLRTGAHRPAERHYDCPARRLNHHRTPD